jgi:hypothetical protein
MHVAEQGNDQETARGQVGGTLRELLAHEKGWRRWIVQQLCHWMDCALPQWRGLHTGKRHAFNSL